MIQAPERGPVADKVSVHEPDVVRPLLGGIPEDEVLVGPHAPHGLHRPLMRRRTRIGEIPGRWLGGPEYHPTPFLGPVLQRGSRYVVGIEPVRHETGDDPHPGREFLPREAVQI
jgi:hypothetical protein